MSHEKVAIRLPGFMKSIGRGIGQGGKAYSTGSRQLGRQLSGGLLKDPGARALGMTAPIAAGAGATGGAALALGDDEAGDQPGLADRITEGVSEFGNRAAEGISGFGDQVSEAFGEEGAIGGLFQDGGMLGGVGDWWRNLDPQTRQAIIYSAIAGGAGLGGYGLYKALAGGGQQQPAYY